MHVLPLVKWVGGKRALLGELLPRVPAAFRGYHEPFLGGGALFFALRPAHSWLSDVNPELMALYGAVKQQPQALLARLAALPLDGETFAALKERDRRPGLARAPLVERGARALYLNKTCFNGLWRVNRRGEFNAAWGAPRRVRLADPDNLWAAHAALRTARLATQPFTRVAATARPGDFVYFDPPYDSETGDGFTRYSGTGFGRDAQVELWGLCVKLHRLGVRWMLSNADTAFIRRLYRNFRVEAVVAPRRVAARAGARRPAGELVVRNY